MRDILLCINTGEKQSTPALREFTDDRCDGKNKRFRISNSQFYLKTGAEMAALFGDISVSAIDNTNEISRRVIAGFEKRYSYPHFPVPPAFQGCDTTLKMGIP